MMTKEQFEREKIYLVMLSISKSMLQKGLINDLEYKKIAKMMLEKYRPLLAVLSC